MPFKKLPVPIDFSETFLHALRLAVKVARQGDTHLRLVYVGTIPYVDAGPFGATVPALLVEANNEMAAEAKAGLDRVAREEVPAGMPVSTEVRSGFPPEEILEEVAACHADLIVLGTHGRTGLERVLLGSVAERVIRGAKVPVLSTH
jgi:nucleotide-binding universal stress UspA family protein